MLKPLTQRWHTGHRTVWLTGLCAAVIALVGVATAVRSEEHTSELQSQ